MSTYVFWIEYSFTEDTKKMNLQRRAQISSVSIISELLQVVRNFIRALLYYRVYLLFVIF